MRVAKILVPVTLSFVAILWGSPPGASGTVLSLGTGATVPLGGVSTALRRQPEQQGSIQSTGSTRSSDCEGIGGPLQFTVYPAPSGMPNAPTNDGRVLSKPSHLQNFGFDPTQPAPQNTQVPRYVGAVNYAQPGGSTFKWTIPSPLKVFSGGGPSDSSANIKRLSAAAPAAVSCTVSITFTDVYGTQSQGSADDDTAASVNPSDPPNLKSNGTTGYSWTTALQACDLADTINYGWPPPSPWSSFAFAHQYWAATRSFTGPGGISVSAFTTKWNPGDPNNSPNGGTASNL